MENNNEPYADFNKKTKQVWYAVLWTFLAMLFHFIALNIGSVLALVFYIFKDMLSSNLVLNNSTGIPVYILNGETIGIQEMAYYYVAKSAIWGTLLGMPFVILGVFIMSKIVKEKFWTFWDESKRTGKRKNLALNCLLGGLCGIAVYLPINCIVSFTFINDLSPDTTNLFNTIYDTTPFWLLTLGMAIAAPLTEELTFRGFIQNRLEKIVNPIVAVILQAVLFGIFHGNLQQFIYATIIGILLGFMKYWSKSIRPAVIAHMFFNFISVVLSQLQRMDSPFYKEIFEGANSGYYILTGTVVSFVVFAIVFYIFEKKAKDNISELRS